MSLTESASSGDRVAALRDLRDIIAKSIEETDSARDVAALAARLQSVLAELASLVKDGGETGDPLDELKARRAARGGSTARSRRASKGAS